MRETRVTLTDLRQGLASLINRAAYGGERIVLISHGEPKAAIIGIEELRRLEEAGARAYAQTEQYTHALAAADLLREDVQRWQERQGTIPEDSTETLRSLREGRDNELGGLR